MHLGREAVRKKEREEGRKEGRRKGGIVEGEGGYKSEERSRKVLNGRGKEGQNGKRRE